MMQDSRRKKLEFIFGGCLIIVVASAIIFGFAADAIIALVNYICGPGWMEGFNAH